MAEAERIVTTSPPPDSTDRPAPVAHKSKHRQQPPTESSKWGHLELLLLASFGAAFGFLTGLGLYGEVRSEPLEFVLQALILGAAAYVLFDPAMELLHDHFGATRKEFPEGRKAFATVAVMLATLLVSALHHSLGESLGEALGKAGGVLAEALTHIKGLEAAGIIIVGIGLIASLITHSWVVGARQAAPRAILYGAGSSFIVASILVYLSIRYLDSKQLLRSSFWEILVGALALLWFLGPGIVGGLAISKTREKSSPTRGILGYLVLFSVIYVFVLLVSAYEFQTRFPDFKEAVETLVWLPILVLFCQNLGWALAPFFKRETCDLHLLPVGVTPSVPPNPPSENKLAPVAVFPSPAGAPALALASADGGQTPIARAQDLLLKPKGDRMWAAWALLVGLIVLGFAYHAGAMLKDPEIDASVEGNLQQDTGLQKAGLTVNSSHRVVTLSGTVSDEAAHAAAVQRALAVRGVKQLIDHIQVVPPAPTDALSGSAIAPAVQPPPPVTNLSVTVGRASGGGSAGTASPQKTVAPAKAAPAPQKPAGTAKAADSQKHQGLLHFLNKDKANPAANPQNPAQTQKPADAQTKQGFFHFLKKDKTKDKKPDATKKPNNGQTH
jgi:hypothetical protein